VQPGSPAFERLQAGDILVAIEDRPVTTFEPLEELLDGAIGRSLAVDVQRGGVAQRVQIVVGDLDAITPASYLEFGEAVLHDLSYQQARHFNLPVRGVFVANPGYSLAAAGVPRGALISSFNNRPVADSREFAAVLQQLADGDRATVRFVTIDEPNNAQLKSLRVDRRWFAARHCARDDSSGLWPCAQLPAAAPPRPVTGGAVALPATRDAQVARLAPSLVHLTYDMPFAIAGITDRNYHGTGVIVDAERGLVVTDRNTVPVSLGDIRLTFAGALEIPGRVEFIHPLHNLALVSYDPRLIGTTPVRSARLDTTPLQEGQTVTAIGMNSDGELKSRTTQIVAVEPLQLPLSRTMQFRDSNLEVAQLLNPPTEFDGVLTDSKGAVRALWSSFPLETGREVVQANRGVSIELVADLLQHERSGQPLHTLDVEFDYRSLTEARQLGLSAGAARAGHRSPDRWRSRCGRVAAGRSGLVGSRIRGHDISRRGARGGQLAGGRCICVARRS
jgi:pro-apoptotic serine protease NMA111